MCVKGTTPRRELQAYALKLRPLPALSDCSFAKAWTLNLYVTDLNVAFLQESSAIVDFMRFYLSVAQPLPEWLIYCGNSPGLRSALSGSLLSLLQRTSNFRTLS